MHARVPDTELPDLYRQEAGRLRQQADVAETAEMRTTLLEVAERFDRIAAEYEPARLKKRLRLLPKY